MSTELTGKIIGYKVNKKEEEVKAEVIQIAAAKKPEPTLASLKRDDKLAGITYKIKPPELSSIYVTINDYDGKPFEIFINSKDTQHFQWTAGLTRVISAVMRRESRESMQFLVDELKSVVDPSGGYFVKGKGFVKSIVSEIGLVLEEHMAEEEIERVEYPSNAVRCHKCGEKAMIKSDGCESCLHCDHSKCS